MLKKNSLHTVEITGCSSEGMGVARVDGIAVFVKHAIVGEICEIKILKTKKNYAYAKIENMIEESPERIEPDCPVYGKCGGCALRHMSYAKELEIKLRRVNDTLARVGGTEVEAKEIIENDSPDRYRNKGVFAVGVSEGRAETGFYRARSHDIVAVVDCRIQYEVSNAVTAAVRNWMDTYGITAYDEKKLTGTVRHVFVRAGAVSGECMAVVSVFDNSTVYTDELVAGIREAAPSVVSIVLNINKSNGNTLLAGDFTTLFGGDYIEDTLCGLSFRLSPRSFYQVNHAQAEKLYKRALEYAAVDKTQTVVDLYCGTGTITLCMAKQAKLVIGAEIVEAAVADAGENALRNHMDNAEFICADAGQTAVMLGKQGLKPDVVVVDPPRKGLTQEVIGAIIRMSPKRVVYVSCDPATMARDIKIFGEGGYTVKEVTAVDMFSRTASVECVCLLVNH